MDDAGSPTPGFPIQKSAGRRLFAPHRSLSQLTTSFFGSQCQGIHPTLLFVGHSFRSPRWRASLRCVASHLPWPLVFSPDLSETFFSSCQISCAKLSLHSFVSLSSDVFYQIFELDIPYVVFKVQICFSYTMPRFRLNTAYVMEMKRFELSTPCLQGRCSPN